jgi:hypothetical protein
MEQADTLIACIEMVDLETDCPATHHVAPLKWSGKFGQRAKMYPTRTNGYENDKATELFRPV